MEVVPTNDGDDDDGVVWFRCPQCQGFLPKLKGALEAEQASADAPEEVPEEATPASTANSIVEEPADQLESDDDVLVGMVPADEPEPKPTPVVEPVVPSDEVEPGILPEEEPTKVKKPAKDEEPAADVEPIMEYAVMLAELDVGEASPYRPWEVYEIGQCINHLAWNDCGVVVAKEVLPGGRKIIKCYFEEAGVVRLIEQAPR